jgi:hypothetical protein
MITEENVIQKSDQLLMSIVDNEAVILEMESRHYIGLNDIGTEIWLRLDQPVIVSSLISEFIELYDEDRDIIKVQVLEFLNHLYDKRLINVLNENQ